MKREMMTEIKIDMKYLGDDSDDDDKYTFDIVITKELITR